jgi:hypothetical protein
MGSNLPPPHCRAMAGLVVELRRIMVAALDLGEHAIDVAVANLRAALQRRGHVPQERVPVANGQGLSGAENGVELGVREPERGHG